MRAWGEDITKGGEQHRCYRVEMNSEPSARKRIK